jgi:periplasmic copper chaperone A
VTPGHRTGHRAGHRISRPAVAVALVAAGLLTLSACGSGSGGSSGSAASGPKLSVRDAYVPEPVTAEMAGGFLTVHNAGGTGDRLTSIDSADFADVQLHRNAGGQMQRTKSLPVPAKGDLRLDRGGNHIMFLEPKRKPVKGEKVPVTLHFEKSDPVTVSMPVEATNYVPEK